MTQTSTPMSLTLTPQANGDLRLSFDPAHRDEIADMANEMMDLDVLLVGTEHYWTNGSYQPFDAGRGNPFVGLTDAPCIAQSMEHGDDNEARIVGEMWYFGNYATINFITHMLDHGHVDFTLHA